MFHIPGTDISAIKIATWFAILIWAVSTLVLLDFYFVANGITEQGALTPWDKGHPESQLTNKELEMMDLGAKSSISLAAKYGAISQIMRMRELELAKDFTNLATLYVKVKGEVKNSNSEQYKMDWSPLISCAMSGCHDKEIISACGKFASENVRFAPNAMIVEAVYYHQARLNNDKELLALSSARLDQLVQDFGSQSLREKYGALVACKFGCNLDEKVVEFIDAANKG